MGGNMILFGSETNTFRPVLLLQHVSSWTLLAAMIEYLTSTLQYSTPSTNLLNCVGTLGRDSQ